MKIKIKLINKDLPNDEIVKVYGEIDEDNEIIDMIKMIGIQEDRVFTLKIK